MRFRDTAIPVFCVAAAGLLLFAGGSQLGYINEQRKQMKLIINEPLENAPPSLAFATVAMGAFRGLVVDILWMRAEKLKEQGQFFDAKQLAEWITTLQPRFASVWDFHAWNMAYNISVAIPSTQPEERWRWVRNGYELLRDEGIPLNPKSILLYRAIGFIFQHKIGGVSDEAHKYYKLQLALDMERLLGPADNEYFKALVAAPSDLEEELESDPDVRSLVEALQSADKAFADRDKFVRSYLSLRENPDRFEPAAFGIIDQFRGTEALKKLDVFTKAHELRHGWKLEPALMQELNQAYGPVDWSEPNKHLPLEWRHPDTHAIYWAVKGLRVAGKKGVTTPGEDQYSADEINTDRIVSHSLQNLFRYGKILIYTTVTKPDRQSSDTSQPQKELFLRPDLRMFEPYDKHELKVIEKYEDPNRDELGAHQIRHRNMMKNAVLSHYQSGHRSKARRIYNRMRKLYPEEEFKAPVEVFVRNRFQEELENLQVTNARELVQLLLRESYFLYALRQDDEAAGTEDLVKDIYDHYDREWGPQDPEGRVGLGDLPKRRYMAMLDFLGDEQFSLSFRQSLIRRMQIEKPELYEQLKEQEEELRKRAEQQP
jgi:hypothetical protein